RRSRRAGGAGRRAGRSGRSRATVWRIGGRRPGRSGAAAVAARPLPREVAGAPRDVARELRELEQRGRLAAGVVGEAQRAVLEHDAVFEDAVAPGRKREAALGERLEVALQLARVDQLRARDLDERPPVARGPAVVGDAQRELRAGDRAAALDEEEVVRRGARAAGREREREHDTARDAEPGGARPRHAATATPPRRGSPAPASAPVAGSRSTACTLPKNRLRERKATMSRPAARSASRPSPGSA